MGRPAGWMKELTGRSAIKPPGAPSLRRDVERLFWREIAKGLTSEDAAIAVDVSPAAGSRWFESVAACRPSCSPRSRAGNCPFAERECQQPVLSGGQFSRVVDSEEIALLKAQGLGVRGIARRLGRDPSTISRELRRNAATRGGRLDYRASVAQWKAELLAERPKTAKLAANDQLREYVQDRLAGQVRTPDGTLVLGPTPAAWKGQNKARRQDRRWATSWSPQQIANRAAASHGLEAMLVPAGQPASGELPSGSAEACAPAVTGVPVTAEQRCEIWQFIWPYGRVTRPAEFTCCRLRVGLDCCASGHRDRASRHDRARCGSVVPSVCATATAGVWGARMTVPHDRVGSTRNSLPDGSA